MKFKFIKIVAVLFIAFSTNTYGQEAARAVEQSSNSSIDLKLWVLLIGLVSALLGAYVSHILAFRRELRIADSHRKTELQSVASVLLAEIRYHHKMVKGRVKAIQQFKSVEEFPASYLGTITFSEPEVYKEYMGSLAHLGSGVTGQLIRFHGTTQSFNKTVKYCIDSEVEVNEILLDRLLVQLSNIDIRAKSCIMLLSAYIEGKEVSIEEQSKIESEAYEGD